MDWNAPMPLAPLLKSLNELRTSWPALRARQQAIVTLDADVLHLVRWTNRDTVHVVHRTTPGTVDLPAEQAAWVVRSSADPAHRTPAVLEAYTGGPFAGTLLHRAAQPAPFDAHPAGTLVAVHPETPLTLLPGQTARVVGSAPEVGGWSARGGAELLGGREARMKLPAGTATALKLVVIDADGTEHWSQATDVTVVAGGRARVRWEP